MVLLLVGVSQLAVQLGGADAPTGAELFHRLLPTHPTGMADPFARIERVLVRVTAVRSEASLVAVPTFLWLSMRLFAAARISLDTLFDTRGGGASTAARKVLGFLAAKGRDAAMVLLTVLLFLANTALSAGVKLAEDLGSARVPALAFLLGGVGRVLTELVAFGFSVLPFWLLYRFAPARPLRTRPAFIAALVTATGFEIAKRLYGAYLGQARTLETVARGDADLLAALLFVLWVNVTAILFLVGGALGKSVQEAGAGTGSGRRTAG